jgi:hypothetical protein
MKTRISILTILAAAALFLGGCGPTSYQQTMSQFRSSAISVTSTDQSWTLNVLESALGNQCMIGEIGHEFLNHTKTPLGGSFIVTVLDPSKTQTIGELNLMCQTAFPGGKASCTSLQRLLLPCQQIYIYAKPLLFPR